jgi:hypothetical protein
MFDNTWERRRQIWENLGVQATSLGLPATSLGSLVTSLEHRRQAWDHLGEPATSLEAPRITVKQSRKNNIFGYIAGAPRNHSYYVSFNNFQNSCIQFVFSDMYLYSYPSTHSVSGLAAGTA